MYRTDGWDTKWDDWRMLPDSAGRKSLNRVDFEAGADAMLEALRKGAIIMGNVAREQATSKIWYDSVTCRVKGSWYFIPDEELV